MDDYLVQQLRCKVRPHREGFQLVAITEEDVTRLLFETGGRISEVTGLTLGDWADRRLLQEASAFSKGSHGMRVKFPRFSGDTAKLLRRYFDEKRRRYDPQALGVVEYFQLRKAGQANLHEVPLFLTTRGTPLVAAPVRYLTQIFAVNWSDTRLGH